eukprot:scaffold6792_cov35-Tisochrysis_lutea.AAC.3
MAQSSSSEGVPILRSNVRSCEFVRPPDCCVSNNLADEPIMVSATTQPNDHISGPNLQQRRQTTAVRVDTTGKDSRGYGAVSLATTVAAVHVLVGGGAKHELGRTVLNAAYIRDGIPSATTISVVSITHHFSCAKVSKHTVHLNFSAQLSDENVLGFYIAMDYSQVVDVSQCGGELPANGTRKCNSADWAESSRQ